MKKTIAEWRIEIDELDRRMVELLNERARAAQEIGRLKRHTDMPIVEPDREKIIFENVRRENHGPFPDAELRDVFERIIAVMRSLQKDEMLQRQERDS